MGKVREVKVWRKVKGYVGYYEVSNTGDIKSVTRYVRSRYGLWRKLKGGMKKLLVDKDGYLRTSLYKEGKSVRYGPHRLVAIAFIKNPLNKPCVNHINGIKSDNRVENLEWCTFSENEEHAKSLGLKASGERNGFSKLEVKDVLGIRKRASEGQDVSSISKVFNISVTHTYRIIKGDAWSHV